MSNAISFIVGFFVCVAIMLATIKINPEVFESRLINHNKWMMLSECEQLIDNIIIDNAEVVAPRSDRGKMIMKKSNP